MIFFLTVVDLFRFFDFFDMFFNCLFLLCLTFFDICVLCFFDVFVFCRFFVLFDVFRAVVYG